METISLKVLATKVLTGKPEGNMIETKSFPRSKQKSYGEAIQETKAKGYGCAACGNRIYREVEAWEMSELPALSPWRYEHSVERYWRCERCGAVFQWIGGIAGPKFIN